MQRRNWLELSRKLVDQYDLSDTLDFITTAMGQLILSFFGEGVCNTPDFPNPFLIVMNGGTLDGTVDNGVAFDEDGQHIENNGGASGFTITASDPSNDRWDLLVIRYKFTGDTPVPKPSDPISTIFLNLHDDFELIVRPGTPDPSPVYPTKLAGDVILAGLQVHAGDTVGTQVTVDLSIRERCVGQVTPADAFVNTSYNITEGQAATALASENFDGILVSSVEYHAEIQRGTAVFSNIQFFLQYWAGTWVFTKGEEDTPMDDITEMGVTFTPDQSGTAVVLKAAVDTDTFGDGTIKLKKVAYGS